MNLNIVIIVWIQTKTYAKKPKKSVHKKEGKVGKSKKEWELIRQRLECPYCTKQKKTSYSSQQSLIYHIKQNHNESFKQFMLQFKKSKIKADNYCNICKKNMDSSISRHMKRKHEVLNVLAKYTADETKKIKLPVLSELTNNQKPKISVVYMTAYAIQALKNQRGTLGEIVLKFFNLFPYYRNGTVTERKNIRQQISTHLGKEKAFIKKKEIHNGKKAAVWCMSAKLWADSARREKK